MILAGDEFGTHQNGNNNVYCQDNPLGWIDWDAIDDDDRAVTDFVRRLLDLRSRHAIFRRASYRDGTLVDWFNAVGKPQTAAQWDDPTALTIGLRLRLADDRKEIDEALILFNAYHRTVPFVLPPREGGRGWTVVLSTDDDAAAGGEPVTGRFELTGRSIAVFA